MSDAESRTERYPGYDVLSKRDTPSWNAKTRAVVDERLAVGEEDHRFFSDTEWQILSALCDRLVPQPPGRSARVPLAALVDAKLQSGKGDGYRHDNMPPMAEAWQRGLSALDAEAQLRYGQRFHDLGPRDQDALIAAMQDGALDCAAWGGMPPDLFFHHRIVPDAIKSYYTHPTAWSEIGFGGPASPRGYVRLDLDRRDPWEARERRDGDDADAVRRTNERIGR